MTSSKLTPTTQRFFWRGLTLCRLIKSQTLHLYFQRRTRLEASSAVPFLRPQKLAVRPLVQTHCRPRMATDPTAGGTPSKSTQQTVDSILAPLARSSISDVSRAVDEAVEALSSLARGVSGNQALESLGWHLSCSVLDTAGKLPPERQDALIEFLRRLTETRVTDANGAQITWNNHPLWEVIPAWGYTTRDWLNFGECLDLLQLSSYPRTTFYSNAWADFDDPRATPEEVSERLNVMSFLAKLTQLYVDGASPQLNFGLFALWTLRDALEDGGADGNYSAGAVTMAATWILFAGKALRDLSVRGEQMSNKSGKPGQRFGDRAWLGFSEERWQVWKNELEVALSKLAPHETIENAVRFMQKLENTCQGTPDAPQVR